MSKVSQLKLLLVCIIILIETIKYSNQTLEYVCESHYCNNAGTCLAHVGVSGYRCVCSPGFTGLNCQINIDDCASRPCANGRCTDLANSYSCSCYSGWEGANCNINTNDCFAGACINGGRCLDGIATYSCDCSGTGFTGSRCEVNIDDCLPSPCRNGATCQDIVKDYHCICYDGYFGKNCSSDILDCTPHKCQHNGTCLERSDRGNYGIPSLPPPFNGSFSYSLAAGFVCLCPRGTSGDTCEVNPNDCLVPGTNRSVCAHASACTDGLASFTCHCLPGYEGPTCSVDINECELFGQPCQNGAKCEDLVADYACSGCPAAFGGKNCSVELPAYSFGIAGEGSSAKFSPVPFGSGRDSWSIELRLLTLSRKVFLLLLGDTSAAAATPALVATINADGHLSAQLLHSDGSQLAALTSSDSVASGSFVSVVISMSIASRNLSLTLGSFVQSASLSSSGTLLQLPASELIIGSFSGARAAPAPSVMDESGSRGRAKRSAGGPSSILSALQAEVRAFRGIITAPIVNGDRAQVLLLRDSSLRGLPAALTANSSERVVNGLVDENVCGVFFPCRNGATCTNVFYNNFECQCPPGSSGSQCSEIDDAGPSTSVMVGIGSAAGIVILAVLTIFIVMKFVKPATAKQEGSAYWGQVDVKGPTGVRVGHERPGQLKPCPQQLFF